jgi:hypothetical protein
MAQTPMILPGDKVFLAMPADVNRVPEEDAEEFDATYPGADFEVIHAKVPLPVVVFVYRDPDAYHEWRAARQVDTADDGVGLTLRLP